MDPAVAQSAAVAAARIREREFSTRPPSSLEVLWVLREQQPDAQIEDVKRAALRLGITLADVT